MPGRAQPRVSVIIATYNWSEALHLSLASALGQTIGEIEVLVVGDGCTDDSEQVVAACGDARARWIGLEQNSGSQSAPNNAGIEAARAPWIGYLGHDDLWHTRHLERLVAAAEEARADLAYANAILYGPPGTGIRWLTGVTPSGEPERDAFLPPSTILHRLDLADRVGPWRPPSETELPVDADWQLRAWDAGALFAAGGDVTVFKFPAAWRRDAYRERRVDEQQALARRLATNPATVERELADVIRSFAMGTGAIPGVPEPQAPGAVAAANRVFKGLDHRFDEGLDDNGARRASREAAVNFDEPVAGHEWYSTELDPRGVPYRWSGPLTHSSVNLRVDTSADLQVELRVLAAVAPDVLDGLRLEVHGTSIPLRTDARGDGGRRLSGVIAQRVAAAGERHNVRLDVHVPRTVAPRDIDPNNTDARPVGIAIAWLGLRRASAERRAEARAAQRRLGTQRRRAARALRRARKTARLR